MKNNTKQLVGRVLLGAVMMGVAGVATVYRSIKITDEAKKKVDEYSKILKLSQQDTASKMIMEWVPLPECSLRIKNGIYSAETGVTEQDLETVCEPPPPPQLPDILPHIPALPPIPGPPNINQTNSMKNKEIIGKILPDNMDIGGGGGMGTKEFSPNFTPNDDTGFMRREDGSIYEYHVLKGSGGPLKQEDNVNQ